MPQVPVVPRINEEEIYSSAWYQLLDFELQGLMRQSFVLYRREQTSPQIFQDYGFVVFPLAKAYEGFLKSYFYYRVLISRETYLSRKFRIGKSLNPNLRANQQDEQWLYDDVAQRFGEDTAKLLWRAWIDGRNLVFHSFPDHRHLLTLHDAGERIVLILSAIMQLVERVDSYHGKIPFIARRAV